MNHIVKNFLLITLGLFMASCLNSANDIEQRDQLVLTLNLNNANDEIVADNDTVSIDLIRFLVGTSFLHNGNGDTLLINQNAYQLNHSTTDGFSQELKGLAQGSFTSEVIYNTLNFEFKKAEASFLNNPNIDEAFTEGEAESERYSMIINGTYNSEPFEFKSVRNFNYELTFQDQSSGTPGGLVYSLNMQADIGSWFLNPDGEGLLNPGEASNASLINDKIGLSIGLN